MKLYSLVWGQCSKTMQSKIETQQDYQQCKNNYDSLKLIKIIREFVFQSEISSINTKLKTKLRGIT
jgi:hypothetical protein